MNVAAKPPSAESRIIAASSEPFAGGAVEGKKSEAAEADRQHEDIEHCAVLHRSAAPCRRWLAMGAVLRPVEFGSMAYVFESGVRSRK